MQLHRIFQSTPSARRATLLTVTVQNVPGISIHALREEGDGWAHLAGIKAEISIHALREEGDGAQSAILRARSRFQSTPSARRATYRVLCTPSSSIDFNPRPPRGGRPLRPTLAAAFYLFQSTPSARRATAAASVHWFAVPISIHALREEGDVIWHLSALFLFTFQSTPSARRATFTDLVFDEFIPISIHALREEGDLWVLTNMQ